MTDVVSELLLKTADVLEVDGWTQGSWANDEGEHCLVGGMDAVFLARYNDENDETNRIWRGMRARVREVLDTTGGLGGSMLRWNDEPGRTADEVIAVLRKAAERE